MRLFAALVVILVLFALYVTWTASRVDRLHARVDAALAALDAQLVRRAVAAEALPRRVAGERTNALRELARAAREAGPGGREAAENDLSRELRRVGLDAGRPEAAELVAAATRVGFARQFYNDAVRDTRALRTQWLPRTLRLGAGRPLPDYFEIDDTGLWPPAGDPGPAGGSNGAPPRPTMEGPPSPMDKIDREGPLTS